jgi:serine/threonine-protein kinase HipA
VRISLAGVQEKLVLTKMPDGAWGRPIDGTPSTHILKPELAEYPLTVENEAFCMRFARHLGLPTAAVETTEIAGRKLIVVERYDRVVEPDGAVRRLHQEDFCQATGTPPHKKYEDDGGPSLRRVADILQATAAPASAELLVAAVAAHVLIGNGDAHGKNYSLLYRSNGVLELAPLYDLMSTLHYQRDRLAMYIDTVQRTSRVTADRIVNEAARWGVGRQRAARIVADILDRAPEAVAATAAETPGLPEEIPALVERQLAHLLDDFSARSRGLSQ